MKWLKHKSGTRRILWSVSAQRVCDSVIQKMSDVVEVSLASPIVALTPLHCNGQVTCPPLSPDLGPEMYCFPMSTVPSTMPGTQKSSVLIHWMNVQMNEGVNEQLPLILYVNRFIHPSCIHSILIKQLLCAKHLALNFLVKTLFF